MTASRVQAQADQLPSGGPDVGEYAGEPGDAVDVDGVLVAAAAERGVGNAAGQVLARAVQAQLDASGTDHDQAGRAG